MDSKILDARKAAGLTRKQVTDILLIPPRTLQNWESGERQAPAWAEKLVCEKLQQISREKNERTELCVDGRTYTTEVEDIDLGDHDATAIRFMDNRKVVAAEWLNANGLMERVDSNGPQECEPDLYYKLAGAADERIVEIGTRLGHTYGRNNYGVPALMDEADDELIQTIKRVLS
jgi:transcriptional regulator with XRE-family HTH domain